MHFDVAYILIRFCLKKAPLFNMKNIDYSYTPGYTLAMKLFCSREI